MTTKLTMVWGDNTIDEIDNHHCHTMEFPTDVTWLRKYNRHMLIRLIMCDFYAEESERGKMLADRVQYAIAACGIVAIFIGEPEQL